MNNKSIRVLAFAIATILMVPLAQAQSYPDRPIRLVVPFAPGGATDLIARIVAQKMTSILGTSVFVENKAGAGGTIGAMDVINAPADGYSLSVATVSTTATNPAINPKLPYDPIRDFTPVINIAATPMVLAVHPDFPARDYAGFLKELKSNPGKYNYGSPGSGGVSNLQTELYKTLTGTYFSHIPYRGSGPALNDAAAGFVQIMFDPMPSVLPFIKDGRLRAIALSAPSRIAQLPDVPTFKEVGLEQVNRMAYYGILGPKGMPRSIVDKLHATVVTALADPDVKTRIEATGSLLVGNTPEEFAAQIRSEFAVYRKVVAQQKLSLD